MEDKEVLITISSGQLITERNSVCTFTIYVDGAYDVEVSLESSEAESLTGSLWYIKDNVFFYKHDSMNKFLPAEKDDTLVELILAELAIRALLEVDERG